MAGNFPASDQRVSARTRQGQGSATRGLTSMAAQQPVTADQLLPPSMVAIGQTFQHALPEQHLHQSLLGQSSPGPLQIQGARHANVAQRTPNERADFIHQHQLLQAPTDAAFPIMPSAIRPASLGAGGSVFDMACSSETGGGRAHHPGVNRPLPNGKARFGDNTTVGAYSSAHFGANHPAPTFDYLQGAQQQN